MDNISFLENLNPEQKEAVIYENGPLLIIAGAGTGKTMAITCRVVWLILEKKIYSQEILTLTFTEKAAQEMEERIDQLLPYGYFSSRGGPAIGGDFWISTFHSFGEKILRNEALEIGLDSDFKILDQPGQYRFIKENFYKFDLDYYRPLGNPKKFIFALAKHFNRLKDENVFPEEYLKVAKNNPKQDQLEQKKIQETAQAYKTYEDLKIEKGYLDFGDLICKTLELFKKRSNILEKYQKQFKYILVDEFQDTNWAQYELIKMLATPLNNLTVSADDDQAIYKFRGASISNVLQFKKDYPNAKEIVLIRNYRSTQNILDLAYKFIQFNNPNRLEWQWKKSVTRNT